jgi:hypothetical protein
MITGFGNTHVTGFAAIGTVVEAVFTEPDVLLRLAEAAVFLARAFGFGLVALRANDCH